MMTETSRTALPLIQAVREALAATKAYSLDPEKVFLDRLHKSGYVVKSENRKEKENV